MPEFSIIVPVYNAEKYLARCVESVLNQIFMDFELILVDDGSTDSSGKICDKYALKDNRIKVFHQTNSGVSTARNNGLKQAQGEWVVFVDADDWIEKNHLDEIAKQIELRNADLYAFGHRRLSEQEVHYEYALPLAVESNAHFIRTSHYKHAVWSYVFKNEQIKKWNIHFPAGLRHAEDQAFLLKYISKIKKVALINRILYNYYDNPNSVVNQAVSVYWTVSNIQAANDFLEFCRQNEVEKTFYDYAVKQLYEDFFQYRTMMKGSDEKELQKAYRKEYKKTIELYPDFERISLYKLASFRLSLHQKYPQWKKRLARIFESFLFICNRNENK